MCWTNFSTGKHNANQLNIFAQLQEEVDHFTYLGSIVDAEGGTEAGVRLHNAYWFKVLLNLLPFGHNLNGGVRRVGICTNRKPTHNFPIPIHTKFCSRPYLSPSGQNSNIKLSPPPNSTPTPVWGIRMDLCGQMVPTDMSTPHSYSTYIHTVGLYCAVWPQYTTRQTDDKQTE